MNTEWKKTVDKEIVEKRMKIDYYDFIAMILEQHFSEINIPYFRSSEGGHYLPKGYGMDKSEPVYFFHVYRPMNSGSGAFTCWIPDIKKYVCKRVIAIYSGDVYEDPERDAKKLKEKYIETVYSEFANMGLN